MAWYGRVKKDPRTIAFEVDPDSFHESIGEFNRELIDCLAEIGMSDVVTLSNPHISVARYGQVGDNKRLNRAEKKYAISIAENLRISKNLGHIGVGGLVVTDSKGIPITS